MNKITTLIFVVVFLPFFILAQELKKNTLDQNLKEDTYDLYQSSQISNLDILRALDISGVRIMKFHLGDFDKKYLLLIAVDEYVNAQKIRTDTLFYNENTYGYFEKGSDQFFIDFIDQVKFISKEDQDKMILYIETYSISTKKEIQIKKINNEQFFKWRKYVYTEWKLNSKIPLMIYGSSWEDKKYGFQRFCGVAQLEDNAESTNELLSSSPNYFVFYYLVKEIK